MIGNDIVDLALAQKESNWRRKGFLDKIFSSSEQLLILNSENPEIMVWNLWSRKEAAYKIYNRQTGIRGFFPLQLVCNYENSIHGTVFIDGFRYYTQTEVCKEFIHTIAVAQKEYFKRVIVLDLNKTVNKVDGIPFIEDKKNKSIIPVSISHHGAFQRNISLIHTN
jgi:phosphopantetheinyl transferase (holo-ACP synthase)